MIVVKALAFIAKLVQITFSLYNAQIKFRGQILSEMLWPCAVRLKVEHPCTLWLLKTVSKVNRSQDETGLKVTVETGIRIFTFVL